MNEPRRRGNGLALMVIAILVFLGVGVWWIESRFDSTTAILVLGGLFGVICLVIGYVLNMASTRHVLTAATDFNRDLAGVEKYRQAAFREVMRGDSAQRSAAAKLELLEAKRIDQIANRRAGLLIDLERQKWQQGQQPASPTWAVDDEDDEDARFLE
jgi:hypothetical protein